MRPIGPSAPMSMDSAAQHMLARFLSIVHSTYGVKWARRMRSCGVLQYIGRILETTGTKRAGGCTRLMTPGRHHACRTWFTPPTYWSCQVSLMKWPTDHMGCWKSHKVIFAMFEQRCCPQGSICLLARVPQGILSAWLASGAVCWHPQSSPPDWWTPRLPSWVFCSNYDHKSYPYPCSGRHPLVQRIGTANASGLSVLRGWVPPVLGGYCPRAYPSCQ